MNYRESTAEHKGGAVRMSDLMTAKNVGDVGLGLGGATSPAWLQYLHTVNELAAAFAVLGGAVLVALRVALAYRELKEGRRVKAEADECVTRQ